MYLWFRFYCLEKFKTDLIQAISELMNHFRIFNIVSFFCYCFFALLSFIVAAVLTYVPVYHAFHVAKTEFIVHLLSCFLFALFQFDFNSFHFILLLLCYNIIYSIQYLCE